MRRQPRVAFFPDSYLEVNGVAHTSRQLHQLARQKSLPFLCVHAGPDTRLSRKNDDWELSLSQSRISIPLDRELGFDWLIWRHAKMVLRIVREFCPDAVHVTGPNAVGLLGVYIASSLRVPLVASWHTHLHDFAASRLSKMLSWMPCGFSKSASALASRHSLDAILALYRHADITLAPTIEIMHFLEQATGKRPRLMSRGVDTDLFSPARRDSNGTAFQLGYVGRLSPEKNVRLLTELDRALKEAGLNNYRFCIVGDGSERQWLERRLPGAIFTGTLTGEALARAYANMDLFVFPSYSDTFGNVILEALASGVPCLVTDCGGPRHLVEHGTTGFVARDCGEFVAAISALGAQPELLRSMKAAARTSALSYSWEPVFAELCDAYRSCLRSPVFVDKISVQAAVS